MMPPIAGAADAIAGGAAAGAVPIADGAQAARSARSGRASLRMEPP